MERSHSRAEQCLVLDGLQRRVGIIQGEDGDLGREAKLLGKPQEVTSIVSGHVGNTANLPFFPE